MDNYFKDKVVKKRNRNKKRIPTGSLVRIHKEVGYVYSSKKKSTGVIVERKNKEGIFIDTRIIFPGRPEIKKDKYRSLKSPTNFHSKKRKIIRDQTHNLNNIICHDYIAVPKANRKTLQWWDSGRYDYKM